MRPITPALFIGRAHEQHEFEEAVRVLGDHSPEVHQGKRVFLLSGEGGWGKSTLLGKYIEVCERAGNNIMWLYVDWEKARVDAHRGTPAMMAQIAALFQQTYPNECKMARFQQYQWRLSYDQHRVHEQVEKLHERFQKGAHEAGHVDFDEFARQHLTSFDYDIYRPQEALSRCLVSDLITAAQNRPLVLLFDTWEVVHDYADFWMRRGLMQYCLTDQEVGNRFLFVVAGRISAETVSKYEDDVRRFTHARGLYERNLKGFTERDISEYFEMHPNIGVEISERVAHQIRQITRGVPLAVEIIGTIGHTSDNLTELLNDTQGGSSEIKVIDRMLVRFFRHLETRPSLEQARDRTLIYMYALARNGSDDEDLERHNKLLRILALRLGLVNNTGNLDDAVKQLSRRYSFLFDEGHFDGGHMHVDVYTFIRKALKRDSARVKICGLAANLCSTFLSERENQLKAVDRDRSAVTKYQDERWQEWLLDLINFRLWDPENLDIDDTMRLIVEHYFFARQYGSRDFHLRLASFVRHDVIYDLLPPKYRIAVDKLVSLKEWFGLAEQEAARQDLLSFVAGRSLIEGSLQVCENAIQNGDLKTAEAYARQAEESYRVLGPAEQASETTARLVAVLARLGKAMSKSSRGRRAQLRALSILQHASLLDAPNPYTHCLLAEVLTNLGRFAEAKVELDLAERAPRSNVSNWSRDVRGRIAGLEGASRYSPLKLASASTIRANGLSAQGAFREAEQLYRSAIEQSQTYPYAVIKYVQLLRQLGKHQEATRILAKVKIDEVSEPSLKAAIYDAMGSVAFAARDMDRAIQSYQNAIAVSSGYVNPRYGLGQVYLRIGRPNDALSAFEEALKCKRDSQSHGVRIRASLFWVWNGIGLANALAGQVDGAIEGFTVAEAFARGYIEHGSRQYQTWSNLAIALLGQSRDQEAKEMCYQFAAFEQIRKAQGFLREMLIDIELIGTKLKGRNWREVYEVVAELLE